ncbi:MAG: uroporphyrinogen decarboxylase family protein [Bacillota bacterium]
MTRRDVVRQAIRFQSPEYVPLMYYNPKFIDRADAIPVAIETMFGGDNALTCEWGFEWEANDVQFKFGIAKKPAISSYEELGRYVPLDVDREGRFDKLFELKAQSPDTYYFADFVLSGFTIASFIRGFDEFLMDFYLEPENVSRLLDVVFGTEEKLIRKCAEAGFDGIYLADDWGTQNSLLINPGLIREHFIPRYKKQVALAHSLGMDVMLHSCGYIFDIIEDLIDAGFDVINPGQANLNGIEKLGKRFAGRIAFGCPVGYQTTAIKGTPKDLENEIMDYLKYLGTDKGGFIGFVNSPGALVALGASRENEDAMRTTFEKYCGRR